MSGAVFKIDLFADDGDLLLLSVGRNNVETNDCAALAADFVDDVRQFHIDDVFHRTVYALTDRDDLVLFLKLALLLRGASLHDALHNGVAVVPLERRADSFEI